MEEGSGGRVGKPEQYAVREDGGGTLKGGGGGARDWKRAPAAGTVNQSSTRYEKTGTVP